MAGALAICPAVPLSATLEEFFVPLVRWSAYACTAAGARAGAEEGEGQQGYWQRSEFPQGASEGLWADFMFKIVPSVALAHTGSGESKLF